MATRREYAWRIAAQSGAMENRLDVLAMLERECAPSHPAAENIGHDRLCLDCSQELLGVSARWGTM